MPVKFCGPYRVLQKLGPVDYLIDTPQRRKQQRVCHVNLLKPYHRRDEKLFPRLEQSHPVGSVVVTTESDFGNNIPALSDLTQTSLDPDDLEHLTFSES